MKKYECLDVITFGPGIELGLTDGQAAARSAALVAVHKGVWRVQASVTFKRGEVIALAASIDLGRAVSDRLRPLRKRVPAPSVKPPVEPVDQPVDPSADRKTDGAGD